MTTALAIWAIVATALAAVGWCAAWWERLLKDEYLNDLVYWKRTANEWRDKYKALGVRLKKTIEEDNKNE